jgi:hypothetical protein
MFRISQLIYLEDDCKVSRLWEGGNVWVNYFLGGMTDYDELLLEEGSVIFLPSESKPLFWDYLRQDLT